MTQNEFLEACLKYSIDPGIALENEDVVAAIKAGDIEQLEAVLVEQF